MFKSVRKVFKAASPAVAAAALMLGCAAAALAQKGQATFTLGEVLSLSAKDELTRGALQRPKVFLDVTNSKKNLQIAIVLDGTESMDREIESVKSNLENFVSGILDQKDDGATIEFAVIVFRDQRAPQGVIDAVISEFTSDVSSVLDGLKRVATETGAPYFNEPVDRAVEAALEQLNWADRDRDAECTRWILICTDAPPHPGDAQRFERLASAAQAKGVEVYAVLCNSGFVNAPEENKQLEQTALQLRRDAVAFVEGLTTATGGKYLDMWNDEHIKQLLGIVQTKQKVVQRMRRISEEEVLALRAQNANERLASGARSAPVSLAVLPSLPRNAMKFDADDQAVMVATELMERFRHLPGVNVVRTSAIESAWQEASAAASEQQVAQRLAGLVGADYVVWGATKADGSGAVLTSDFYRGATGEVLFTVSQQASLDQPSGVLGSVMEFAQSLRKRALEVLNDSPEFASIREAFASADADDEVNERFQAKLAQDYRAHRALLEGLANLGRALRYKQGDVAGVELLDLAEQRLLMAEDLEPHNPFVHLLLANCYYNKGRLGAVDDFVSKQYRHLSRAYKYALSDLEEDHPVRLEIEADYQLLIAKDAAQAVERLQKLAEPSAQYAKGDFALRANWMLAGILLGDWEVAEFAPEVVDVEEARQHILRILCYWNESQEAAFYRDLMDQPSEQVIVEVGGDTPLAAR